MQKKEFTEFYIYHNEKYLKKLLNLIKENSDENYELVIFYNGHGDEKGFSFESNDDLEPKELEENLNEFKGKVTLFANCCFSGNITDYFENNKSNIIVISASKNGEAVEVNEFGKPGYLVEDLLKSDMDLENFSKHFKAVPKAKYYPRIYIPSN